MGATTADELGGPPPAPDVDVVVEEDSSTLTLPEGEVDLVTWIQSDEVLALLPPKLKERVEQSSSLSNAELALLIGEVLAVLIENGDLNLTFEELVVMLLGGGGLDSLEGGLTSLVLNLGNQEQSNVSLLLVVLSLANELGLLSRSDARALNQALDILADPNASTTEKVNALTFIVGLTEEVLGSELGDSFNILDFPALSAVKSDVEAMQDGLLAMSAAGSGRQEANYGIGSTAVFGAYGIPLAEHERTFLDSDRSKIDQQIFMVECIIAALPPGSSDLPIYLQILDTLKNGGTDESSWPDLLTGIDSFSISDENISDQFNRHYDTVAGRTYSDWMDMAADSQAQIDARTAFLRLFLATEMVEVTDEFGKPVLGEDGKPLMRPLTDAEIEERIANDPTIMYHTEFRDHALAQANIIASSDYEGDLELATLPTELVAGATLIEFELAYTFTLDMRDSLTEAGGDPGLITRFGEMADFFETLLQRIMDQLRAI